MGKKRVSLQRFERRIVFSTNVALRVKCFAVIDGATDRALRLIRDEEARRR